MTPPSKLAANKAYRARQEAQGVKIVSFMLSEYARTNLAVLAQSEGISKNAVIEEFLTYGTELWTKG